MQLLFDNLAATLMAGTVMLILMAVGFRGQQTQQETTSREALRQQQVSFIETLRRDMLSLSSIETLPACGDFTFYAWYSDENGNMEDDSMRVRYDLVTAGQRDGETLYELQRLSETAGGTFQPDGASMSTLTSWELQPLNEDEGVIDDCSSSRVEAVEKFRVAFESIPPLSRKKPFERQKWRATFRPMLLRGEAL